MKLLLFRIPLYYFDIRNILNLHTVRVDFKRILTIPCFPAKFTPADYAIEKLDQLGFKVKQITNVRENRTYKKQNTPSFLFFLSICNPELNNNDRYIKYDKFDLSLNNQMFEESIPIRGDSQLIDTKPYFRLSKQGI